MSKIRSATDLLVGRWRWRKATSLDHLANMQADRLARVLAKQADDSPKWQMYSTLVALGRAGVVVHDWRPGTRGYHPETDTTVETRACVTGFADEETKYWIDELLYDAGRQDGATKYQLTHVFELYGPGSIEYDQSGGADSHRNDGCAWVERINGEPTYRIGGQMTADQVRAAFPAPPTVHWQLRQAWQITILAPQWGQSSMWADLLPLLVENRRAAVA